MRQLNEIEINQIHGGVSTGFIVGGVAGGLTALVIMSPLLIMGLAMNPLTLTEAAQIGGYLGITALGGALVGQCIEYTYQ
ncbi:MAG: hypothetical protein BGO43_03780 [Gammaproteobacteria bacterium 39-13]|nr:hypothetical protein [Gammaproteobacteria bacterium]OJV96514.1 MAG: hypothetical protein BGO43_03780 [Gammaproteobacteria bacterium 39-13]